MKLYTKLNCAPCANVKAYLEVRPDLSIEIINCSENPERVQDFIEQCKSFPCLQKEDGSFLGNSEKILEYFSSIQAQTSTSKEVDNYFWGI